MGFQSDEHLFLMKTPPPRAGEVGNEGQWVMSLLCKCEAVVSRVHVKADVVAHIWDSTVLRCDERLVLLRQQ